MLLELGGKRSRGQAPPPFRTRPTSSFSNGAYLMVLRSANEQAQRHGVLMGIGP